ncbi:MAG: hypothetical protein JWM86_2949, partial [Thermoleophilia bacterium]|nr:hypothetical protein [Thermoleophilia bacterium]
AVPGASLLWRPSRAWSRADPRPWIPIVTLRRALARIDLVTRFDEPWNVDLSEHDYRRALPAAAAELLGVEDAARIDSLTHELLRLEQEESTWRCAYGPEPRLEWPGVGA